VGIAAVVVASSAGAPLARIPVELDLAPPVVSLEVPALWSGGPLEVACVVSDAHPGGARLLVIADGERPIAIAGVMGAYLVLFPRHLILTLVFVRAVTIPAVAFLGLWFASQFLFAGETSGIAWQAHVAGFLFGAVVTVPLRDRLLARVGVPAEVY
jgi:hypothetical protein